VAGEDLSRGDFSPETLDGRRFHGDRLVGADFSEGVLRGVVFEDCDLSGAELTSAELVDCRAAGTGARRGGGGRLTAWGRAVVPPLGQMPVAVAPNGSRSFTRMPRHGPGRRPPAGG
jgi:hypothetical protein